MEEIIILIIIALSLLLIFGLYKILDKDGIYYSMVILSIASYLLSFKITTVLKTNINLNIATLIGTYTCLYILLIKYNKKDLQKALKMTFYASIILGLILTITNFYVPILTETVSSNMKQVFEDNYKILILYPFIFLLGGYVINKVYNYVTIIQNNIFLSIMLSYIISAVIYTIVFSSIGYINILNFKASLYLGITTYIIGIIITGINIGFIYLLTKKKVKK